MKGDDKMIKWSKNYLMGIDKLDEEHKELFRISDQIYNKVMESATVFPLLICSAISLVAAIPYSSI